MSLEFSVLQKSPKFKKLRGLADSLPKPSSEWESVFTTCDSVSSDAKLYLRSIRKKNWRELTKPRCMIIFHGQGEHSGRYEHMAHFLDDDIDIFFLVDHQGHGQSTGIRGHVKHFDNYAEDGADIVRQVRKWLTENSFQGAPLHLFAHSMGGLIAFRMLIKYPDLKFNSVSISNPMIELAFKVPKWKETVSKGIRSVIGCLPIKATPLAKLTSRDPEVVKNYINDPLGHNMASPDFYWTYLDMKADTFKNFNKITQTILLLIGEGDKIIYPQATLDLFTSNSNESNTLKTYKNMYHELINDYDKELVFSDIKAWINSHQ